MTPDVIEEMARAMQDVKVGGMRQRFSDEYAELLSRRAASVLLGRMMKPTHEMIPAGSEAMPAADGYDLLDDCIRPWQAMLKQFAAENGIEIPEDQSNER